MSSIPVETGTYTNASKNISSGTTSSALSGMTFIDNSNLSVCEKIKLYFAKNSHAPSYQPLNSPNSSSSSASPDFDASFRLMLEESRRRKIEKTQIENPCKSMVVGPGLLMDDTTIDLCSSPESVKDLVRGPNVEASPNLSAFNGTFFGPPDSSHQRPASRHKSLNNMDGYESDESLGVAELNDSMTEQKKQHHWYMKRSDSINSFLEHEKECEREAAEEQNRLDNLISINETQLFDTEAPPLFWDQTIVSSDSLPLFPMGKTNAFRTRPSTIAEESTINSSGASSIASKTSAINLQNVSKELKTNNVRESIANVFPKKLTERLNARTEADRTANTFPIALTTYSEPIVKPKLTYRESSVNVFPKKKTRDYYALDTDLPSDSSSSKPSNILSPIQSPIVSSKKEEILTPILLSSASMHNAQRNSPKPSIKPNTSKCVSPHRKSLSLMTFDENSFNNDSEDNSDDSLNTARQFNDTIEAMDFYMDRGQKLLKSAVKKPQSPKQLSPTSTPPNLLNFSPKTNRTTPDTIRRRLLMRNLLRNSDVLAESRENTANRPQFSHAEMRLRRSIRRMDESFED